ncbi:MULTISPECIES: hypothetical protein [unclassified Rhodococcus (in: high G+C Gram-positive bacteria)]|uniref:hypothetical protein n=1 Tax=unclassified Rhodococcus (in: high G+C Gram-positive bacteria) TaxID=192944 RepID=UPI000A6EAC79|nr:MULTISPECIES: hypothetical protein [unclassified Rhodococcus (in: high G+C Gram-positive bacteria)]
MTANCALGLVMVERPSILLARSSSNRNVDDDLVSRGCANYTPTVKGDRSQ